MFIIVNFVCFSPLNSRSSTNISRQSTQDYSDGDLYTPRSGKTMQSPARARWMDAFHKVCAQINSVSRILSSDLPLRFFRNACIITHNTLNFIGKILFGFKIYIKFHHYARLSNFWSTVHVCITQEMPWSVSFCKMLLS